MTLGDIHMVELYGTILGPLSGFMVPGVFSSSFLPYSTLLLDRT